MIIKYRVAKYYTEAKITEVECTRETKKSIWRMEEWGKTTKEYRYLKETDWVEYYDTWIEAWTYLLDRGFNKVAKAKDNLAQAIEFSEKVNAMKQEKEPDAA